MMNFLKKILIIVLPILFFYILNYSFFNSPLQLFSKWLLLLISIFSFLFILFATNFKNKLICTQSDKTLLTYTYTFSWSVFIVMISAVRGFANLDESFITGSAYRIAEGNVPYRDFFYNVTPLTIYIQALIFKVFGFSIILSKYYVAIVNGVFAILTFYLLQKWLSRRLAGLIALISSVWFYSIMGTPWYDHDAYLMVLLGIVFLTKFFFNQRFERIHLFISGLFFGLSTLSKQNIGFGAMLLSFLAVYVFLYYKKKQIFNIKITFFILGSILPLTILLVYFWKLNALTDLYNWLIIRPSQLKKLEFFTPFYWPIVNMYNVVYNLVALSFITLFYVNAKKFYIKRDNKSLYILTIGLLCFGIYLSGLASQLGGNVLFQQALTPIVLGLTLANIPKQSLWKNFVLLSFIYYVFFVGLFSSYKRVVFNPDLGYWKPFDYALQTPRLHGIWMDKLFGPGLDEAAKFITQNIPLNENVLVFPNSSILLFATNRTTSSPVVQFLSNSSVSPEDQSKIIDHLEKGNTRWILMETKSQRQLSDTYDSTSTLAQLATMAKLAYYLEAKFQTYTDLTTYQVLTRR